MEMGAKAEESMEMGSKVTTGGFRVCSCSFSAPIPRWFSAGIRADSANPRRAIACAEFRAQFRGARILVFNFLPPRAFVAYHGGIQHYARRTHTTRVH